MSITQLPSKNPSETIPVSFLFGNEVPAGATLQSCVITVSVLSSVAPADPNPSALLSGTVDLSQAPTAIQMITGGIDGTSYLLKAVGTLNTGMVLVRQGALPITVI